MGKRDEKKATIERRDLLRLGTAATVGYLARGVVPEASAAMPPLPANPVTPKAMPIIAATLDPRTIKDMSVINYSCELSCWDCMAPAR